MPEERWTAWDAERYDELAADMFRPGVVDPAVALLAELAAGGGALELAVGSGRIALPLARRGVRVPGVDSSAPMVSRLRAKPAGEEVVVTVADAATARVGGTSAVVYMVRNAITNLATQDEQVACFATAAAHLEPGGCFLIEVDVPDLRRLPPGETVRPFTVGPTRLGFDEYDVVARLQVSHHFWKAGTPGRGRLRATATCGRPSPTSWRGRRARPRA